MNPQAEKLNKVIVDNNPALFDMLSSKAQGIFFPWSGILGQSGEAKGKKYNATIGIACEDDGSPMRLNALSELVNLSAPEVFPYAPSFGNPKLRQTWKDMLVKKNPSLDGKSISVPVVTQALTHGLSLSAFMFLNEGDEIVIPTPYWGNYNLLYRNAAGANISTFPCFKDNSSFDLEALAKVLEERQGKKVVLLLNFPNNPTGYTPTEEEMTSIAALIKGAGEKGTKVVTLIDDAYFGLVYEKGIAQESIFAKLADIHENVLAVKIDGATKEDYVWGLRVGFMTFGIKGAGEEVYKAIADKLAGAIRGLISNCSNLSQSLLLKAYTAPDYDAQKESKYVMMKERYEVLRDVLAEKKEYEEAYVALPYNSGYFMCVKPKGNLAAEDIRKVLLEKYDTGIIAQGDLVRIAFSAIPAESIPVVMENIYKACKEVAAK
ncbi:MAG: aminotransferase class I/II-fold pyridoxal phosphate-dependent enzyme [Planctomycetes bacterium]|nr:aminotransferase class I/II-fold pyridoxal phosphate-dependent enzyme [Planctomycetota bacterium]